MEEHNPMEEVADKRAGTGGKWVDRGGAWAGDDGGYRRGGD